MRAASERVKPSTTATVGGRMSTCRSGGDGDSVLRYFGSVPSGRSNTLDFVGDLFTTCYSISQWNLTGSSSLRVGRIISPSSRPPILTAWAGPACVGAPGSVCSSRHRVCVSCGPWRLGRFRSARTHAAL